MYPISQVNHRKRVPYDQFVTCHINTGIQHTCLNQSSQQLLSINFLSLSELVALAIEKRKKKTLPQTFAVRLQCLHISCVFCVHPSKPELRKRSIGGSRLPQIKRAALGRRHPTTQRNPGSKRVPTSVTRRNSATNHGDILYIQFCTELKRVEQIANL